MIEDTFLIGLAEIGATFAGFAAVAVVIGRSGGRDDLILEGRNTNGLVVGSVFLVLYCVLPFVMSRLEVGAPWRMSGAIAAVIAATLLAVAVHDIRSSLRDDPISLWRARWHAAPSVLLILGMVASFGSAAAGWIRPDKAYTAGVLFSLLETSHLVVQLVQALLFKKGSEAEIH